MATVLVVDDAKVDRILVEGLLGKDDAFQVECMTGGADALDRLKQGGVGAVVTDLVMPGMDGLELTVKIREEFPGIPVVIMTAQGSERVAVAALEAGAASYVPKSVLAYELRNTVRRVLTVSRQEQVRQRLMEAMLQSESSFVISNDTELIGILVKHLQECAALMGLGDETSNMQIGVALQEALINASQHGNLELKSDMRESDMRAFEALVRERSGQDPYKDRVIHVGARFTRDEARFVIRDEGPGFDPATLPDPRDPENLHKVSGRGVLLMRAFMDEVSYNDRGNEVTLSKRREEAGG